MPRRAKRARVVENENGLWIKKERYGEALHSSTFCLKTTQTCMLGNGQVPQVVLERIFSFALINLYMEISPRVRDDQAPAFHEHTTVSSLCQWMPVCHYWYDVIDSVLKAHDIRTLHVNLASKSEGYEQLQKLSAKRGPHLLSLKISRSGYPDINAEVQPQVDWNSLFSLLPNLKRLDLSSMQFLTRPRIAHILDTVSMYCLKLEALLLPLPYPWAERSILLRCHRDTYTPLLDMYDVSSIVKTRRTLCQEEDGYVMKRLEAALERWYLYGPSQGLLQLGIYQTVHVSKFYLTSIAQYAPHIQYLEGWKASYFNDGFGPPGCLQQWNIDLNTWLFFCEQCRNLVEFNWIMVPFTDAYFKAFGAIQKEYLTSLLIDLDDQRGPWNIHETAMIPRTHSPHGFRHILNGLPWLTYLHINLHPRLRIDLDVFDDNFLTHLATTCRMIQHVWISECGGYEHHDTMSKITDRGLEVLGSLPSLRDLKLRVLERVTVYGIMALIAPSIVHCRIKCQRNIKLSIAQGDFKEEVVTRLLQHLKTTALNPCSPVFALQLHSRWQEMVARNTSFCATDPLSKSMLYRCRTLRMALQPLIEHVQDLYHGYMKCQVVYNARVAQLIDCTVYSSQWKKENDPHHIFLPGDLLRLDSTTCFQSEPTLPQNAYEAIYGRAITMNK